MSSLCLISSASWNCGLIFFRPSIFPLFFSHFLPMAIYLFNHPVRYSLSSYPSSHPDLVFSSIVCPLIIFWLLVFTFPLSSLLPSRPDLPAAESFARILFCTPVSPTGMCCLYINITRGLIRSALRKDSFLTSNIILSGELWKEGRQDSSLNSSFEISAGELLLVKSVTRSLCRPQTLGLLKLSLCWRISMKLICLVSVQTWSTVFFFDPVIMCNFWVIYFCIYLTKVCDI